MICRVSSLGCCLLILFAGCSQPTPEWEAENPLQPIPQVPLGISRSFSELQDPPTPERVRLGKWLFHDPRLSADGTISCATCHRPDHAFSEPTPVSTGIDGQKGGRKAPPIINMAWTVYPHFFWDGRAGSLEEQALGPVENPIEMGNTLEGMLQTLRGVPGYARYFEQSFGTPEITAERVAKAIADYERTRMSGNSPWDCWRYDRDEMAVSESVKLGHELFFDKAGCSQCHFGDNFTDSLFHNLGVGWNPEKQTFSDQGRFDVTQNEEDRGAFKTPTLREVSRHAPYMHDGSVATLREVVELYNRGGEQNPFLDAKMSKLNLSEEEIDALVAFMNALDGEGFLEAAPPSFPR